MDIRKWLKKNTAEESNTSDSITVVNASTSNASSMLHDSEPLPAGAALTPGQAAVGFDTATRWRPASARGTRNNTGISLHITYNISDSPVQWGKAGVNVLIVFN